MKFPAFFLTGAAALVICAIPPAWAETVPDPAAAKQTAEPPHKESKAADGEKSDPVEKTDAAETSGYVRLAEDENSTRLEVAVAVFTLPDGRQVDLFGVVHMADASYYKEVDRRLGTYDAVLFELVGDPASLQKRDTPLPDGTPPAKPHPLRGLQQGIGNVFHLAFQLD